MSGFDGQPDVQNMGCSSFDVGMVMPQVITLKNPKSEDAARQTSLCVEESVVQFGCIFGFSRRTEFSSKNPEIQLFHP